MKRLLSLALIGVVSGSLVACDPESVDLSELTPETEPPSHYVALGDSYAALGSADAETDECRRSADNYPSLVRNATGLNEGVDSSCSGAVTGELLEEQVGSLNEDVDLITLSIGGNDIGFPEIAGCFEGVLTGERSYECIGELETFVAGEVAKLPESLDAVYTEIKERSPEAEIITTGYMPLMSTDAECGFLSIIPGQYRQWAVDLTDEVNGIVRDAATRHEAHFVMPDNAYAHTVCAAPGERWTDLLGDETNAYAMHPTPLGQQVMANTVAETWNAIN